MEKLLTGIICTILRSIEEFDKHMQTVTIILKKRIPDIGIEVSHGRDAPILAEQYQDEVNISVNKSTNM